ncbi:MAG: ATP-grasp domain-containing protein [Firmicutes bacterium]|nr:ATP-grasp domain-containing protein [Bacillota bacterium]
MAVLVTDGDQRATLAVVRSLGRAGIRVVVGHSAAQSLAGSSRYCARRVCYPSPWERPHEFQQFLQHEMHSGDYRVLLPMTDVTTLLTAPLRAQLPASVCLPMGEEASLRRAQDKAEVVQIAERLGIAVPASFDRPPEESLEAFAARLPYPVVIKPRFSRMLRNDGWISGSVRYAQTAEELQRSYAEVAAQGVAPLVQEKIEGEGRGVFLLVWSQQLQAAFCHRRLLEKPPWGGASVLRESLPLDESLVEQSFALLRAIGWNGPAMVEYKQDRRDGKLKLMEINARFWGSLQLAIDAGLDFPLLLYRLALGERVAAQFHYRPWVRSRWRLGELDYLLAVFRHQEQVRRLAPAEASRWRALGHFLKPGTPNTRSEVLRWDDPAPGWFELKLYLRDLLRRPARALPAAKPKVLATGGSSR